MARETMLLCLLGLVLATSSFQVVSAQAPSPQAAKSAVTSPEESVALPPDYVIGVEDALSVVFWRDETLTRDVVVRPDGKISLPLLNDIQAAGLTPEQLRRRLIDAASKFISEPNATVVVKEILSRKVFVTGNVKAPGTYKLTGPMNVIQLLALAGGLAEYADSGGIVIMRPEGERTRYFKFNYNDVIRQRNVEQNIALRPGDTVVVP
jgi:polysaccharide export outer membrane protein